MISKAINHHLWPFLADSQRAYPFQGRVQRAAKMIKMPIVGLEVAAVFINFFRLCEASHSFARAFLFYYSPVYYFFPAHVWS